MTGPFPSGGPDRFPCIASGSPPGDPGPPFMQISP